VYFQINILDTFIIAHQKASRSSCSAVPTFIQVLAKKVARKKEHRARLEVVERCRSLTLDTRGIFHGSASRQEHARVHAEIFRPHAMHALDLHCNSSNISNKKAEGHISAGVTQHILAPEVRFKINTA
jgi:hypothetical protein